MSLLHVSSNLLIVEPIFDGMPKMEFEEKKGIDWKHISNSLLNYYSTSNPAMYKANDFN